jgi:small-conductance mechanosensitive channel
MRWQSDVTGDTSMAEPVDIAGAMTSSWDVWLEVIVRVGAAVAIGLIVHIVLFWLLSRAAARNETMVDDTIVRRARGPARLAMPLLALMFVMPAIGSQAPALSDLIRHAMSLGFIAVATWLAVGFVKATEAIILARHDIDAADNLEARRIHTQLRVIKRTLVILIVIVGVAAMLMTFPRVRQLGWSLLASAGLAGLVVGFAARPMLENLIAGLQIALTQPIRLDDVVVIAGEWGRIEEITSTYVVVRIWDQRRLIVPFSKVLAEPFQNWTRTSAQVLGTAYLHADYTVPVGALREELERYVKGHDKWDERAVGLQVTGADGRTVELRALVSAANASDAWDLRCDVREHLIDFLQREHPSCLPREREERLGARRESPEEDPASGQEPDND